MSVRFFTINETCSLIKVTIARIRNRRGRALLAAKQSRNQKKNNYSRSQTYNNYQCLQKNSFNRPIWRTLLTDLKQ